MKVFRCFGIANKDSLKLFKKSLKKELTKGDKETIIAFVSPEREQQKKADIPVKIGTNKLFWSRCIAKELMVEISSRLSKENQVYCRNRNKADMKRFCFK